MLIQLIKLHFTHYCHHLASPPIHQLGCVDNIYRLVLQNLPTNHAAWWTHLLVWAGH